MAAVQPTRRGARFRRERGKRADFSNGSPQSRSGVHRIVKRKHSTPRAFVESPERGALHQFLDTWLAEIEQLPSSRKVRWALDVDPIELF